jgi:hypothetical protein
MKEWDEQGSPVDDGQKVLCFTDGSKMEGMAGSGFFVSGLDAL